jgi:hypothetical protein
MCDTRATVLFVGRFVKKEQNSKEGFGMQITTAKRFYYMTEETMKRPDTPGGFSNSQLSFMTVKMKRNFY